MSYYPSDRDFMDPSRPAPYPPLPTNSRPYYNDSALRPPFRELNTHTQDYGAQWTTQDMYHQYTTAEYTGAALPRREVDLREQLERRRKEREIERRRDELEMERQRDELEREQQRQERELEQRMEDLEQERRRKEREGATKLKMRMAAPTRPAHPASPPRPPSPAPAPSVRKPVFHDRGFFLAKDIIQAGGPSKTRLMSLIRVCLFFSLFHFTSKWIKLTSKNDIRKRARE